MNNTLVILGCGNLGSAILLGILSSLPSETHTSTGEEIKFSRIIACVRQQKSAERIRDLLGPSLAQYVKIESSEDHAESVSSANYVILGCKPNMVQKIVQEPRMAEALSGKILISICAGVTHDQIEEYLQSSCTVVRVMPNIASSINQSTTVIQISRPELPVKVISLITWIFSRIGTVTFLPAKTMDIATAICGSGPAFFALTLDAAIDGAVTMGMSREDATKLAAQSMKGAAELVLAGEHPAILKDKVSSPGGCTTKGLLVLEEGAVRGHVARAIREATSAAELLGAPIKKM